MVLVIETERIPDEVCSQLLDALFLSLSCVLNPNSFHCHQHLVLAEY